MGKFDNSNFQIPSKNFELVHKNLLTEPQKYQTMPQKPDTVELSGKKSTNKASLSKKTKALIGGGITLLGGILTFIIYKGKKSALVKKAEREAQILAETAAQDAKTKAEQEAKLAAERAETARIQSEQEAKLVAERAQNAKAEAENAAEEAKMSAEKAAKLKVHQDSLKNLEDGTAKYHTDIDTSGSDKTFNNEIVGAVFNYTNVAGTTRITDDVISLLSIIEEKGDEISVEELKQILSRTKTSKNSLQKVKERIRSFKSTHTGDLYDEKVASAKEFVKEHPEVNLEHFVENSKNYTTNTWSNYVNDTENKNNYVDDILTIIEETPKEKTQKTSEYLKGVIDKYTKNIQAENKDFEQNIKSRLSYSGNSAESEAITLTKEERQQMADEFNKIMNDKRVYTADDSLGYMSEVWKRKYISGYTPDLSPRVEKALLAQFPQANPTEYYQSMNCLSPVGFDKIPVVRWMAIGDLDTFMKQFEKEGSKYKYNQLQSTSISYNQGETTGSFTDWNHSKNVKFIIHPKGDSHHAALMEEGKYGDWEAIYPANTEFKFLGKMKRRVTDAEFPGQVPNSFERWEIHLQEV